MPAVELIGVNKWYGAFHVLKNIDLLTELEARDVGKPLKQARADV